MGPIIEHEDSGNDETLRIGDSSSPISVKIYQDIYHQITGRTEQIRKRYTDNVLIEFSDVEQLHHKINQLCDVHNVVARNESISVFHNKDRKDQFTSFERFRLYNSNTASPTVTIVLKYNFSIIPAGINRPQEYVVTIRLTSRVAMLQQAEENAPSFMRGRVISFLNENTAEISVEYADYVVARGYLEAFDEWIRGSKCSPSINWVIKLQRWSYLIPNIFRNLMAFSITWFALGDLPEYFNENSNSEAWVKFLLIYAGAAYILISLSNTTGKFLEEAIDNFPTLSYLKLNKGDIKVIDEFQSRRKSSVLKLAWSQMLAIALAIVASKLEKIF